MPKFRWKNYKSFKDTGWIDIKPITIILGSNGSGKSTIIQPPLLLGQTLESADESIALMPTGEYVRAGSYEDLIYNKKSEDIISFDFDFSNNSMTSKKKPQLGILPPVKVSLEFSMDQRGMPKLNSVRLKDQLDRQMLYRELRRDGTFSLDFHSEFKRGDKGFEFVDLIENQKPKHFLFNHQEILNFAVKYGREQESKKLNEIRFPEAVSNYIAVTSYINSKMMSLFEHIKYIGPLRDYPKRFYEYRGEYHPEVGQKGQHTYSLLYELLKEQTKESQLNKWLNNFGLAKEVHCKLLQGRSDLLEIFTIANNSGLKINFADTCFGVSQILPLLVQSIVSNDGDIVITEQPEIHLNPNCETVLADFFVEMTKEKKVRYVIETHSEHYMLRLRTHVKKGNISCDDIAIYMTEKGDNCNTIRKIDLDSSGEFLNNDWPIGFFEQSLSESLMFATAKKETKQRD